MDKKKKITYKDSGVDVTAGYKTVSMIKQHVDRTFTEGVLTGIGGFGGLFSFNKNDYEEPVLVSGTDGVGTKLMVAFMMNRHDTIGEDCVAMCVNDVLCQGAKPMFFLDYIATGNIKPEHVSSIVEGIANGCVKARVALVGGETAEMPGMYGNGEYDVAGFAVGIVDKKNLINPELISEGNVLIGLPSNGLHSNGFSLIRKLFFDIHGYKVDARIKEFGTTLGEELLKPTRIYSRPLVEVVKKFNITGISHITGGGFYENIPRIVPEGYTAKITTENIEKQPIFEYIKELGNIETKEMYSTFNMGVGIVMAVNKQDANALMNYLDENNEKYFLLGEISKGETKIIVENDK